LDTASLGPIAIGARAFALQEYFVPVSGFVNFVERSASILRQQAVNALNISIRHSPEDQKSTLAWARQEVFSFVLYYRQHVTPEAQRHVQEWTQQLVDASLSVGGTYYLPYQLSATRAQFEQAYPNSRKFVTLKSLVDPHAQFRNKLIDKYIRV
jgi:FAD/FMN-containing dehydrogenase